LLHLAFEIPAARRDAIRRTMSSSKGPATNYDDGIVLALPY